MKSTPKNGATFAGLKIDTKGLTLMETVKPCVEGMSPLMERFSKNKTLQQAN